MRSSWPRKSLLPLVKHMQPYIAITDVFDHLERCRARFERREPEVRAFLPEKGRFERLQREAQELAARFPEPQGRPPLYGVLVGVKDIFRVTGFATRAGSQLPPEALAGPEAECVRALKAAGALILGKTVTTEFAYFAPGPTRNPHNPEHTPGGSSSGSAAAVGAGICDLALGTQTIGSIVRPAAFCGVVGFKPSYARVSRKGVIPLAPALDHVGWFAPAVPEAVQAANVLFIDWRELDPPQDKPVLGVPEGSYLEQASADGLAHFRRVCQQLSGRGYQLLQVPAMPDFQEIRARHELLLAFEASCVHAGWFAEYAASYAPQTAELIRRGLAVSTGDLARARAGRARLREELTELMTTAGIDLWISPSAPGPAPKGLSSTGNPVMNLPWTQAGMPSLNLPSGVNAAGLPLGLQVTGRWYGDEALLAWATDLEKALEER
jgi:Asp-tRNA(Asn)/Glu-tRNA(Gln) amidotransferase A subunit family amidase